MTREFFIFYAEASFVCILTIAMLFVHDMLKVNRQEKQIRFNMVLLAHMAYFVSDACWAAVLSGYIQRTMFTAALLNISNCIIIAFVSYAWLQYVAAAEHLAWRNSNRGRWIARIPIILMGLLIVFGFTAAPDFWISKDGEVNPIYYPMMFMAPFAYMLSGLWFSIREARKVENAANRQLYFMLGIYPVIVAAIGAIQIAALTVPLFCFGTTIVLLYFYIAALEDQVSTDPLTNLNNRGQLNRYVSQSANLHKAGLTTYIVMIDVNDFKDINDCYGHAEGDRALITVAETLKSTMGYLKHPSFIGRYGGDEFILILHAERETEVKTLAASIRRHLEMRAKKELLPFRITVGIGYDELAPENDSFQECMKRADKKLYKDKALQKRRRRGADPMEA